MPKDAIGGANSAFYDDASKALNLDHRSDDAGTLRRLSISGDSGGIRRWERSEEERLLADRAATREREIQKLLRDSIDKKTGLPLFTRKQAEETVDREAAKTGKERKAEESAEAHRKSIENLMDIHKKTEGGGSKAKGRKTRPRITAEQREQKYAEMVGEYEDAHPTGDPEEMRAHQMLERNASRLARHGNLKGKEPRMHVQGRMEPSIVAGLHNLMGRTVVEAAEEMHRLLAMAKTGADAQMILDALRDLLEDGGEQECA